jgi:hypothetical protein
MVRKVSPLTWFAVLLLIGVTLAFAIPPSYTTLHTLHISAAMYRTAILTLILPYGVIWFAAFYAFDNLERYAIKLGRSAREGKAFRRIANGVGIMAWGLALPTIISLILGGVAAHQPGFKAMHIIINNYILLLVPLISFNVINKGTRQLIDILGVKVGRFSSQLFALAYITIGVFFVYFVLRNHHTSNNPYHLAIMPLIITLIIPYLYAWLIGLLSAYELWLYARKAVGVLYKQALVQLSGGIAIVIAAAIAVQYITSSYTSKTNISLTNVLIIMYALLAVQALGYVMIALGAKRLKIIEEV